MVPKLHGLTMILWLMRFSLLSPIYFPAPIVLFLHSSPIVQVKSLQNDTLFPLVELIMWIPVLL